MAASGTAARLMASVAGAPPTHGLAHAAGGGWNLDPLLIAGLAAGAAIYWRGTRRLAARRTPHGYGHRQALAWGAALSGLFVALISPLDSLAADLFSAHMVQHLILLAVVPPLIVLARPELVLLSALPLSWRRRLGRSWARLGLGRLGQARAAGLAVITVSGALWVWHVPAMYDLAVQNEMVHAIEHASFVATSLVFWWAVLRSRGTRRMGNGLRVLCVFAVGLQGTLLGALLTFAGRPVYSSHVEHAPLHGLTPLQDQQAAGLIMWLPPLALYVGAVAVLFVGWMRALERRAERRDRDAYDPAGGGS